MSDVIRYGRKRKGILLELNAKLKEWTNSIKDDKVRELAKRDSIVTGGSIASMLLGEKINDFDIYFKTMETAKAIAEYYVQKFNEKNKIGGEVSYKPVVRIENRTNIRGVDEERVIIWMQSAGVAAEDQGNYGYFEQMSERDAIEFVESTVQKTTEEDNKEKYRPVFMSENAITLSDKVQLVTRFYGHPEEIHKNYDFVHAMCYFDYKEQNLVYPSDAMEALLSRTLVYRGSLYPVASIFRAKKFIERGWRITAGQLLKIMWQISELDLSNYSILREQLTGVDMAYMWELIKALQDVDKDKINSVYVAEIIDRIFD